MSEEVVLSHLGRLCKKGILSEKVKRGLFTIFRYKPTKKDKQIENNKKPKITRNIWEKTEVRHLYEYCT